MRTSFFGGQIAKTKLPGSIIGMKDHFEISGKSQMLQVRRGILTNNKLA